MIDSLLFDELAALRKRVRELEGELADVRRYAYDVAARDHDGACDKALLRACREGISGPRITSSEQSTTRGLYRVYLTGRVPR